MLSFASSDRFKVAANALRAIGFFFAQVHIPAALDSAEAAGKVRTVVFNALKHKSPKVSWNACIVIGKVIKNQSLA